MPRWRVAPLVFRALLVFRAPEGPATVWLCCCVAPRVFRAPEGPAAVCAGGRRPAREPSALRASLGASPRSPARPRHRPPAPRQIPPAPSTPVGPGVLRSGLARCLAIRPGPAAAHRHRGRSLRRPPHQWCQVADVAQCVGLLFGQALSPPTGTAAWPWTLGGAACVAVILGRSATRCYKRRQSEQHFVRSPEWLLQTSSIHRFFR